MWWWVYNALFASNCTFDAVGEKKREKSQNRSDAAVGTSIVSSRAIAIIARL